MKINIRGDKLEVTDAIRNHITSKLRKLDQYFDNPDTITANVVIKSEKINDKVEVTIPTSKFTIRAEVSNNDLYSAVDLVIDKLENQIRRNKGRLQKRYKEKDIAFDINVNFEIEESEVETSNIVRRKQIEMKPMSEEEAILQMELLGHDFFVYKNEKENCISVLYKRKDNSYGIIDTN